jgi:hypothetical protein
VTAGDAGEPFRWRAGGRLSSMWALTVAYLLIPSLIGAFAIALFLTRRQLSPSTTWPVGLTLTALLVAGISWTLRRELGGNTPAASLLSAFATLYFIPFVVLTGAASGIRSRVASRGLGIALLVGLFLATSVVAHYASGYFFDIVNAAG